MFDPLIEVAVEHRSDVVILLEDLGLERLLNEVLNPILDVTEIYWIPGNHDGDRDEQHDHLFGSKLADCNLHGRVVQIGRIRIAGFGGVFRNQAWYPREEADTQGWPSRIQERVAADFGQTGRAAEKTPGVGFAGRFRAPQA